MLILFGFSRAQRFYLISLIWRLGSSGQPYRSSTWPCLCSDATGAWRCHIQHVQLAIAHDSKVPAKTSSSLSKTSVCF